VIFLPAAFPGSFAARLASTRETGQAKQYIPWPTRCLAPPRSVQTPQTCRRPALRPARLPRFGPARESRPCGGVFELPPQGESRPLLREPSTIETNRRPVLAVVQSLGVFWSLRRSSDLYR